MVSLPSLDPESIRLLGLKPAPQASATAIPDSMMASEPAALQKVAQLAAERLPAAGTASEIEQKVTLDDGRDDFQLPRVPATAVLTVTSQSADPGVTPRLARTWAESYLALRRQVVAARVAYTLERERVEGSLPGSRRSSGPDRARIREIRTLAAVETGNLRLEPSRQANTERRAFSPLRNVVVSLLVAALLAAAVASAPWSTAEGGEAQRGRPQTA